MNYEPTWGGIRSAWVFRGSEEVRIECGSTDGAERVFGEPGVGAFQVEGVVATGDHPCRLIVRDLVEADGAFGTHDEILTGDGGKFLEVGRGKAFVGDGLSR